ncbi:hypothetical protein P8H26_11575 [Pseudochrobactrum sp. sp1633]|uniref:hypothetical protein n=1 Tax=Pseudochrobactrum sp. sp1633 TaxID=3036706 RepID=UPI0025A51109|nr:hypothetical protein [Pseudochrobactrum sp. sp1633]MDM8346028.1 hypothetical protein [Pseudochrobactrum sp. sp1633]
MSHSREYLESRVEALKLDIERHKKHLELIKLLPNTDSTTQKQEISEYERRRDRDQHMLDQRHEELASLQKSE